MNFINLLLRSHSVCEKLTLGNRAFPWEVLLILRFFLKLAFIIVVNYTPLIHLIITFVLETDNAVLSKHIGSFLKAIKTIMLFRGNSSCQGDVSLRHD